MNSRKLSIPLSIPAVVVLLAMALPAGADTDAATVRRLRESGEILPLEKILERARKERPGEVLETELERKGARHVYEVEILDAQGRVWELKFDARSGELLRQKQDD
ncbi:MAG TPA: PepSY domain-containing protein [Rhodocyclaceae bacterium]|nr:PepSY domain-containing protein [Rhodocyclaceae bacterium]HNA05167.1 PepSY domain-containing protein [Rhodocyclaceae bacterium]HNB79069.1 PepSY domain-containing protein [Rhodocyclaceae bacterium]HNH11685.1 PepSY domain-containing protein [Rhodocyclaceae bacterium]HNI00571.1 PepSY domain-containing protein [Rhodocyclaceae bacterium]